MFYETYLRSQVKEDVKQQQTRYTASKFYWAKTRGFFWWEVRRIIHQHTVKLYKLYCKKINFFCFLKKHQYTQCLIITLLNRKSYLREVIVMKFMQCYQLYFKDKIRTKTLFDYPDDEQNYSSVFHQYFRMFNKPYIYFFQFVRPIHLHMIDMGILKLLGPI
jgi:hypothetical protein